VGSASVQFGSNGVIASSLSATPTQSIEASVQCVDSSADGTFSVVIGYTSNVIRKELTSSKLSPNRPVIHTHFDRLDKNTLDFNDPNITTKLSGPITYFKGVGSNGNVGVSSTSSSSTIGGTSSASTTSSISTTSSNISSANSTNIVAEQKAMVIQGQGTETISWEFIVDGKTYTIYANKDYAVKCQKPTVQIIDGNAAANLIPPVDPKYIVYEYSNIFNNDNKYFLATENESAEAGTQVKFYSTATRDVNKPTSLWYMDTTTSQIKLKATGTSGGAGMCLEIINGVDTKSQLFVQICNKNNENQKFTKNITTTGISRLSLKKTYDAYTSCLKANFGWNILSKNLYIWSDGMPVFDDYSCNTYSPIAAANPDAFNWVISGTSNPTTLSDNYNKFEMVKVDCLENAKKIFGGTTDNPIPVTPVGIGQNNETLSVAIKFYGVDRIMDCKDIVQMQSADTTNISNLPDPKNKSLYGEISFGAAFALDTYDLSGLPDSSVMITRQKDLTRKGQNWYYDIETGQIKSAYEGMCLAPVLALGTNKLGIKTCDKTAKVLDQKWNILTNYGNKGQTRIQNQSNNYCIHGEWSYLSSNTSLDTQDIFFNGMSLNLIDCQAQNGYWSNEIMNISIKSQIDPRDMNLIGLENDRLQKLYNGSTPAKDTSTFGTFDLSVNGNKFYLATVAQINNWAGDISLPLALEQGMLPVLFNGNLNDNYYKFKWKYNSTTKQILNENNDSCLEYIDFFAIYNNDMPVTNSCSTVNNKQKWNVMKMTNGKFMIQNVQSKGCLDSGTYNSITIKPLSCGVGIWSGGVGNYDTTFPIVKVSMPLINILSNTNTSGKRWTLDVKAGVVGDGSELFVWEAVGGNTNQMFAYNPGTNEIYYNPSKATEPTNQKVIITDPTDPTKKIEVPVFVKNFSEAMACVDAVDGAKGAKLKINPCNGKLAQKWSFTTQGGDSNKPIIKNIAQNFCIDAEGSWLNPLDQMYNGRNAVVWDCTGTSNQQFQKYEGGELLAKNKKIQTNVLYDYANLDSLKQLLKGEIQIAAVCPVIPVNGVICINLIPAPTTPQAGGCYIQNGYMTCPVAQNPGSSNPTPSNPTSPVTPPRPTGSSYIQYYYDKSMVFDINNINTANQTAVRLYKNNNGIGQKWDWNPTNGEVKGLDNKCLDAGGNTLGQYLRINDCNGGSQQKWQFTANYGVRNLGSGLCTGLAQANSGNGSFTVDTTNGNDLFMVTCNYRDTPEYLANCTAAFQNTGSTGYNSTGPGGSSCGVTPYVAPTTNPSSSTTTSGGTTTGGTTPTSGGTTTGGTTTTNTGTTTSGGGTGTSWGASQMQTDLGGEINYSNYPYNSNKVKNQNYPAIIAVNSEVTWSLAQQIANESIKQLNDEVFSGFYSCDNDAPVCFVINDVYRQAVFNYFKVIYRFLVGYYKAIGSIILDFTTFLLQAGFNTTIFALPGHIQNAMQAVQSFISDPKVVIKSLTNPNFPSILPTYASFASFRGKDIYQKVEDYMYYSLKFGTNAYFAYKAALELAQATPAIVASLRNLTLSTNNVAKSLIGLEAKPGLPIKSKISTKEPVFVGENLAVQSLDDVSKYAPSAVEDIKLLQSIEVLPQNFNQLRNLDKPIGIDKKLTGYSLNITSSDAQAFGKAKGFRDELGITLSNKNILANQLADSLKIKNFTSVSEEVTNYGFKFTVDSSITGANGVTKNVRSSWIYDNGKDPNLPLTGFPRLITAFLKY
jgi:Ricin-type beta-trefoil lectin domain/Cytolethal distending toxin A/C domain